MRISFYPFTNQRQTLCWKLSFPSHHLRQTKIHFRTYFQIPIFLHPLSQSFFIGIWESIQSRQQPRFPHSFFLIDIQQGLIGSFNIANDFFLLFSPIIRLPIRNGTPCQQFIKIIVEITLTGFFRHNQWSKFLGIIINQGQTILQRFF